MIVTDSDSTIVLTGSGFLGVAKLLSYGTGGPSNNTGFTFADNFKRFTDAGISGEIMAAALEQGNTSSHEFGHALGLRHFSSPPPAGAAGNADIFPDGIMATLDFGLSREIWQSGLADAGGGGTIAQDDVAVISNGTNTFGYRPDDHDDQNGTPTPLTPVGNTFSDTGIIELLMDSDYFSFTTATSGDTAITASVDDYISNLDIELRLYNSSFVQIGSTSDPAGLFDATIFEASLAAGTYYVEVRSDGENGEQGQYSLDISVDAPLLATGAPGIDESTEVLEVSQVELLLAEAINRWDVKGLDAAELASVSVQIVSLPGQMVGSVFGNTIFLDPTAAGHGWYIDSTPGIDSEFETPGNQGEQNRIDLLTVLMHEVGHVLELGHSDGADDLMAATLGVGVRFVPIPALPTGIAPLDQFANGLLHVESPAFPDVVTSSRLPTRQSHDVIRLEMPQAELPGVQVEAPLAVAQKNIASDDFHGMAIDDEHFSEWEDELLDEELLDLLALGSGH